jgi:hypothetical protein
MADQGLSFADAMGRLAEQKTLAESHGVLLKRHVIQQTALIQGHRLYDEAKAKSDGLIERLLVELAEEREPQKSAKLRTALEEAVQRRDAFSRFVGDQLPAEKGAKAIDFGGLFQPAADVVNKLIDSAMTIWQEWRGAKQLHRETIRSQIEAQRWRPFDDL